MCHTTSLARNIADNEKGEIMYIVLYILAVLGVVFTPIAIFLGKEMVKKFNIMHNFTHDSELLHGWWYPGAQNAGYGPGMRNIVLTSTRQRRFGALLCFKLKLPWLPVGLDWYGMVWSDDEGRAVFSTYLGRGSCSFQFLIGSADIITASSTEADQKLKPTATFPPHWWQRLGIYG